LFRVQQVARTETGRPEAGRNFSPPDYEACFSGDTA